MTTVTDESTLPAGWTLERVRGLEPGAEMLDPSAHFVVSSHTGQEPDYEVLQPTAILTFDGLCLCLVPEPDGSSWWWMGQLDITDGSITCWSTYSEGNDLEHAIRSL